MPTGSHNYTHRYDPAGRLVACSEAVEFDHYGQPGTGYGNCPHDVDDDGTPVIVETTR